jgi:hypothetical protein
MSDGIDKPKNKWSGRLSNTKDSLEIARQLLVVIVILVLIFYPIAFKSTLSALGIKKIGLAGAELEVAQEASERTGDAAQRLEEAAKTTKSTLEQLDTAIKYTNNEEQKKRLEEAKANLNKTLDATNTVEQKLNTSLDVQTSILQKVEPGDIQASGTWGIVISADKELVPDAQDEVKRAQNLGYQNIKVYERQRWLRAVVEFSNFAEAQAALPRLRSLRSSSYLVNMDKWCPSRNAQGNGVWQCVGQ